MEPSQFAALILKWFTPVVLNRVETLNGTSSPVIYLWRRFLSTNSSVLGRWETIAANYTRVTAFVIAMDSSIPKVKRDGTSTASGDIPKFGIEMSLNEKQLTEIGIMQRSNNPNMGAILRKIFADSERCVDAAYELMEALFLEGLSSGKVTVEDSENVGIAFEVDFGYYSANKFGVNTLWSDSANAKPLNDLDRFNDKAKLDGKKIKTVMMNTTTFNNMVAAASFKDYFAFKVGYTGTLRTTPDLDDANKILSARYGFTIELVDRTCRKERNGIQTIVTPWADGVIIGICSEELGNVEYSFLAEEDAPVPGVAYTKANEFILLSKFRQNRPSIIETTNVQGRALPVIGNVDDIYQLNTLVLQA